MGSNENWNTEDINLLKSVYENEDVYDICSYFPERTMVGILIKANRLGLKKIKKNRGHTRKYYCDFDYFEQIDSCDKAYHLGWAFTDGNVCGSQYRIRIRDYDVDVLENLNDKLNSTYKIYKRKDCVELDITNQQFVNNLINKGCTERKSYSVSFPHIDKEYLFDFIKGVFEGDGSYICTEKTHKINLCSSSKNFLYSMKNILEENGIKSYVYFIGEGGCGYLEISSKKSMAAFLNKILNTNSYFMKRKLLKINDLLKFCNKNG